MGDILNNLPNGKGKIYSLQTGKLLAEGTWKEGLISKIDIFDPSPIIKKLKFQREKNILTVIYKDGSVYDGEGVFQNGRFFRHGYGKFEIPEAKYKYEGNWQMD